MPINIDQTHLYLMVLLPLLVTLVATVRVLYALARGHTPRMQISEAIQVTLAFIVLTAVTLLMWQVSYSAHELQPIFESPVRIVIVGLGVILIWNVIIAFLWRCYVRDMLSR